MKLLFINPPWIIKKGNIWNKISAVIPPIGLAHLASVAQYQGADAEIIDAQAENLDFNEIQDKLQNIKKRPNYIGITATTSIINNALKVAKISKDVFKDAKVILGGVHPSYFPEEVLANDYVDYVVRNEGEETIKEIISDVDPKYIMGLSYKVNAQIINNSNRPFLETIENLPIPAYHLLPMDKYRPALGGYKQLPGIGMITSRGCPGRCTFCSGQYFGKKIRSRSPEKIFEEINLLYEKYGIREIAFYDDTFTALKQNIIKLCNLLIENNIKTTWSCFARVDFVDNDLLRLMKNAGCHQICYGVESASEEILNNIKKKTSIDKAKTVISLTKKIGIEARITLMFGNPGESMESMEKTLKFTIALDPDIALFNITTPYPGTEMYEWADKNGYLLTKDWSKYDLANPVMKVEGLESEDIKKFYKKAYYKFYLRSKYISKRLFQIGNIKTNLKAIQALLNVVLNP